MSDLPYRAVAAELQTARKARTAEVHPPGERFDRFTIFDALEVARHHAETLAREGAETGRFEIGLTYEPTWERVGATEPFGAPMPTSSMHNEGVVALDQLACPRTEAEVLVWLSSPIHPGAKIKEVRAAVGAITLGFEVVDSHYRRWRATPPDLLADFGCHGGLVSEAPVTAGAMDLDALDELEVYLIQEDQEQHRGRGVNVPGGPLQSIVEVQPSACASRLASGHVVATASLTGRSHPLEAGQRWKLDVVCGPALPPPMLEVR